MSTDDTDKRGSSDRRYMVDRRSWDERRHEEERRHGERRVRNVGRTPDRRSGKDRRKGERRQHGDRRRAVDRRGARRRQTAAPYTEEERARVDRIFARRGYRLACPACGGPFSLGVAQRRGPDTVRHVTCEECGRSAIVTNSWVAVAMVITRETIIRETISAILKKAGHEVVEPPNTGVALDIYLANPADVVFMDSFALENMNGQEFIRRLRMEDPDARFVVLTPPRQHGRADPAAVASGLGASIVLRMPFQRDDILRALKEARE